jgi:hypothetical protein
MDGPRQNYDTFHRHLAETIFSLGRMIGETRWDQQALRRVVSLLTEAQEAARHMEKSRPPHPTTRVG